MLNSQEIPIHFFVLNFCNSGSNISLKFLNWHKDKREEKSYFLRKFSRQYGEISGKKDIKG